MNAIPSSTHINFVATEATYQENEEEEITSLLEFITVFYVIKRITWRIKKATVIIRWENNRGRGFKCFLGKKSPKQRLYYLV